MLKPTERNFFYPSQHLQPLTVSMFWPDEPQHMLGLTEHIHTNGLDQKTWCVSVYTRGRGEMFLAKAQSGIRHLSLPRTNLTPFCLFLEAVARVNHSTALLAISDKLPYDCSPVPIRSQRQQGSMRRGCHRSQGEYSSRPVKGHRNCISHWVENYFSNVWRKKARQLPLFSVTEWKRMYSNTRLWLKEYADRQRHLQKSFSKLSQTISL